MAVEKIITSKLLKPGANKRIATVDRHVGIVRPHFPIVISPLPKCVFIDTMLFRECFEIPRH